MNFISNLSQHICHCRRSGSSAHPVPAEPAPAPSGTEFEFGWSEERLLAWRKAILGPSDRGPIEFSLKPDLSNPDLDAPVVCYWSDGASYEVSHLSMDPFAKFICGFGFVLG